MNERIQALRGVAIVLVLLQHGLILDLAAPSGLYSPGWSGVHLFFVISGCVITASLMRDRADFRGFMIRRVFRLWPALLAFLLLVWVLNHILAGESGYPHGPMPESRFWIYAAGSLLGLVFPFLVFGVFMPVPFMFAHIWSLSVEDLFYVAFGLAAFRLLQVWPLERTIRVLSALLVLLVVLRALAWSGVVPWVPTVIAAHNGIWSSRLILAAVSPVMLPAVAGMDFIIAGVVIACLAQSRSDAGRRFFSRADLGVILIPIALIVLSFSGNPVVPSSLGTLAVVGLPIALVLFGLSVQAAWQDARPLRGALGKILKRLGDLSYSLYLVHMPMAALVSSIFYRLDLYWQHRDPISFSLAFFPVYALASIACAALCYRFIERPMIAYGRRVATRAG
ncbi:MAG: acyltransferase [Acetobacteraceae bacterium]|nr:acyltransferase [Acetobacteraceae bacterium]